MPSLVNKARLLTEKYNTIIGNENQQTMRVSEFLVKHNELDEEIKLQKARSK